MYSRSHFTKGMELMILLVAYQAYGSAFSDGRVYLFLTMSMWFLVCSWLFAPFVFNPSGFDWQKTVEDWTDWKKWMGNRGGIGIAQDKSWESWWDAEQQHLKYTNVRGRILEILLSLRFFIYQYGLVYHLNIARGSTSILVCFFLLVHLFCTFQNVFSSINFLLVGQVYALSWLVMITVLLALKVRITWPLHVTKI